MVSTLILVILTLLMPPLPFICRAWKSGIRCSRIPLPKSTITRRRASGCSSLDTTSVKSRWQEQTIESALAFRYPIAFSPNGSNARNLQDPAAVGYAMEAEAGIRRRTRTACTTDFTKRQAGERQTERNQSGFVLCGDPLQDRRRRRKSPRTRFELKLCLLDLVTGEDGLAAIQG